MDAVTKSIEATVEPVESEHPNGEFTVLLSTDDADRDGENLWAFEWQEPLPDRIHFDTDHAFKDGKSVAMTAGSAIPEITENGDLLCKGVYAGTEHGQTTRQVVNEGHVQHVSVACLEHVGKDGRISREILNGTFTGVPSNTHAVVLSSKAADSKKPYGNVTYADPKNGKYPIDTEEHVRAAWSYINMPRNAAKYSSGELSAIKGRIRSAMRRHNIEIGSDKSLALSMANLVLKALQDIGAASVYDTSEEVGETAPDDETTENDSAAAQAVHDAAVALGAMCEAEGGTTGEKTYHSNVVGLHTKAADTADTATLVPVPPVTPADMPAFIQFKTRNSLKEYNRG